MSSAPMGTTLHSPTMHIASETVDVSPALGLFVQPAQLCNYCWCMRRAHFAHGLAGGGRNSLGGDGGTFAVIQAEE